MSQFILSLPTDRREWLSVVDLVSTSAAAGLWVVFPQLGSWLLLLALLPWAIRFWQTSSLAINNFLAAPIWIFMLTAVGGLWAAYNPAAAWAKFWLIIASFFVFYTLANQPARRLWLLARLLGLLGVFVGAYFLLINDWAANPIGIVFLDNLAGMWMGIRPFTWSSSLDANKTAGSMAVLVPFGIAAAVHGWRNWSAGARVGVLFAAALVGFALLLTGSRGAFFALALAMGLWGWSVMSGRLAMRVNQKQPVLFWSGVGLFFVVGLIVLWAMPGSPVTLANLLPGSASADSRAAIYANTLSLVGDFPFIGGGLDSFAGLYSQYVLVIPQRIFFYAHNLYLDVALEQGILGLGAFLSVVLGSFWLLGRPSNRRKKLKDEALLRWAVAAGLVVMLVHGLLDDAFYGNRGTPLLFLLPGLAVALGKARSGGDSGAESKQLKRWGIAGLVVFLTLAGNFLRLEWQAAWRANMGAIEMARVELVGWPTNKWDDGRTLPELQPARQLFLRATEMDPFNRTGHHRLGMIAMLERDYETAVDYLEAAYEIDSEHSGIRKSLAYSYIWNNQIDEAYMLLGDIPEAQRELEVYSWWWTTQGRDDLAQLAVEMVSRLKM